MNVNLYIIEDYENEPPSGPKKTNPNKPKTNPISSKAKIACRKIRPHPLDWGCGKLLQSQRDFDSIRLQVIEGHRVLHNNVEVENSSKKERFKCEYQKL